MPEIKVGSESIKYETEINNGLKHHYLRIRADKTVVIRGRKLSDIEAKVIILKKANWILKKQNLIKDVSSLEFKNGMTVPFIGNFFTVEVQIGIKNDLKGKIVNDKIVFTIALSLEKQIDQIIPQLLENFYRHQAQLTIPQRLDYWSEITGNVYKGLKFRKLKSKWGSCSSLDVITINIFAMKLSKELIDYLLVHELCHIKEKNHGSFFWKEVTGTMPHYKTLDKEIRHTKV